MTDELLSLLEDGPSTTKSLTASLERSYTTVYRCLLAMEAQALVTRTTGRQPRCWALAGWQAPVEPPTRGTPASVVCVDCGQGFQTIVAESRCRRCRQPGRHGPPSPIRLEPDPESPRADDIRTVVVDGIEFEAISIGSRAVTRDWPEGKRGRSVFDEAVSVWMDKA